MSSSYYGGIAGEEADAGGNPLFDSMTDGEIAAYFKDQDREPREPDYDAIEDAEHSRQVHGGGACNCPVPTQEEIEAQWAQREEEHRAEVHGGGPCNCTAPF